MTDTEEKKELDPQQRAERDALEKLSEIGGRRVTDSDLVFEGTKLVIPETMQVNTAIRFLKDYQEAQEEHHEFQRVFDYRPWDGAFAFEQAVRKIFGSSPIGKETFSLFGRQPPETKTINVGVDQTAQVPWGRCEIRQLGAEVFVSGMNTPERGPLFSLSVEAPKKFASHVEGLFKAIEDELQTNSIYRGKAIDGQAMAEFIDVSTVDNQPVVFSEEVQTQLKANLWSVIKHADQMERLGMPMKRAALLEGEYGCGKTLAAMQTGKVAVENGWTFVYCRPGRDDLMESMSTARLYQPSVVFFEDVDNVADPSGEGSDRVSQLLDAFDGVQAKGTRMLAVMTTNHVERIHKGMVRPGRLDAVIHIGYLDRDGVEQLVTSSVPKGHLAENIDFDAVYKSMEDFMPAFVKEAVDRALRYAVARTEGEPDVIDTEDLVHAAQGLRPQLELMHEASDEVTKDRLSASLQDAVEDTLKGWLVEPQSGGAPTFVLGPNGG